MNCQLLILDFGSQYTQLIARRVRELEVHCEIIPGNSKLEKIISYNPKAIIFSGGPASVNEEDAPYPDDEIFKLGLPILGICYGMQLLAKELGGEVSGWGTSEEFSKREFGRIELKVNESIALFDGLQKDSHLQVWMSHGDKVSKLPAGFVSIASSINSPIAAMYSEKLKFCGLQFHPEVEHTEKGKDILANFLFKIAELEKDWNSKDFIKDQLNKITSLVKDSQVVCALSGGVDSTVAAVLVSKAIGKNLHCFFVDNGLLRQDESAEVMQNLSNLGLNITLVNAQELFLDNLKGITDPEQKRKIIGKLFIDVFEEESKKIPDAKFLLQGTLYPDVIESIPVKGNSVTIKSHHNVGGLKENMKFELLEPFRELFKDQVRLVGKELNISDLIIKRQPFPGPGLAVRCLGEITEQKLKKIRLADKIIREEIQLAQASNLIKTEIWQSFAVLLPVQSVGVMGDGRTYDETIAIRAVSSQDGMTADWVYLPEDLLRRISSRIVNETPGINRVVLDVSSKPPATIEWE